MSSFISFYTSDNHFYIENYFSFQSLEKKKDVVQHVTAMAEDQCNDFIIYSRSKNNGQASEII